MVNAVKWGRIAPTGLAKMLKMGVPMTVLPLMPAILHRVTDIVRHLITGVGDEIFAFLLFAFAK
jgi:hypothetical protein